MKQILKTLQMIIMESRWIALIGVIASAVSAIIVFVYGSYEILNLFQDFWKEATGKMEFNRSQTYLLSKIISSVIYFLTAMLMYVFSAGIHALFIGKLESESDPGAGKIMQIQSLENMKEKVIHLIQMILVVIFAKFALTMDFSNAQNLLYLSIGIILIAGSVYLSAKK